MNTVFFVLLVAGLFLIGAEIFIPGGVIGTIGGLCLIGAIVIAFATFPAHVALLIAVGIVVLLGLCLVLWIRFFPRTPVGKSLTLAEDGKRFKATRAGLPELLGKEGVTQTELRPAGIAKIDGQRVDVVTESDWVAVNVKVRVIEVEGNRIVVREVKAPEQGSTGEASA
ncbi:MAG: nodulation efficiency protein D [Kiritimatiellae bacterium]|nr:nodulation efficiency protein D [Kiritimatiellia bacterium]